MGNLGAQKAKRNDTPISAKKDIMGDKTVRVRADLHHIIKIETAKNGGNVKEVMEIRLRSKLKSVLIVHYLKNRNSKEWRKRKRSYGSSLRRIYTEIFT